MSTVMTLEVPDHVYEPLMKAAHRAGQSLEEWILARLRVYASQTGLSEQESATAMARLLEHAGSVDLGHPTGIDNEQIDADLARESSGPHEESL